MVPTEKEHSNPVGSSVSPVSEQQPTGEKFNDDSLSLPRDDLSRSDEQSKSDYREPFQSESDTDEKEGHAAITRLEAVNRVLSQYGRREFTVRKFTLFGREFGGTFGVAPLKILMLFLLFVQGYGSGLDGMVSGSLQPNALSNFKDAPLNGSINTVKSVIAAAVLVPYARLSDKFGRIEIWLLALLFYTVGRIVTAATPSGGGLFAGTVIWELGYAGFRMIATALLADFSGLRDRTFFMNIYLIPVIINLWVSGDIVQDIIGKSITNSDWRWGFGMFCIIVPVITLVMIIPYGFAQRLAKKKNLLPPRKKMLKPGQNRKQALWDFIQDIDLIGILLFAAILVLILLPITIAGGLNTKWRRAYIIAMICVGGGLIPFFAIWEWKFARVPFIPKQRLDMTFYIAMAHEFFWRLALSVEMNNSRYVLLVAFAQSQKSAQRLGQLYDFMQACTNIGCGIILHFYPHPKLFVVMGAFIGLLGMGLMYKYRVAYDGVSGYIGADVLVGLGGGLMRYPMYTLVHAGIPHNQMAVATGFMMTMYQVGAAVGSAVGTAVWTQKLAQKLVQELGPKLGMQAYKDPITLARKFKLGTPERDGLLAAYSYIQRLLIIVSISFSALVVVLTFFLRNYSVGKRQSFTEEERQEKIREVKSQNVVRQAIGY